jgi:hypothetical protein
MPARHQRFVRTWLFTTFGALALVVASNVLVDLPGAYPNLHLNSFEPLRYRNGDRVHKAEMARRGRWENIILGSSRARAGFPAQHPLLPAEQTCNLSVDAARFPELVTIFDYARQHNPLKRVILGVDLYMFTYGPPWILDFPESRFNPDYAPWPYHCKMLLSQAATSETWAVLLNKLDGYTLPPKGARGFHEASLGKREKQRDLFNRVLYKMGAGYRLQVLDPSYFELFRHVVRVCRDEQIDLQVAILPVHALDIELLYASGRWSDFEKWKTGLANVLAEEKVENKAGLWDFTGYSGPTTEPIPVEGDVTSRMKYYLESSHFTPALGALVLNEMLGPPGTPDFGVKINRSNLTNHLARILQDRAAFARTNVADVQWVQHIISEAAGQHK